MEGPQPPVVVVATLAAITRDQEEEVVVVPLTKRMVTKMMVMMKGLEAGRDPKDSGDHQEWVWVLPLVDLHLECLLEVLFLEGQGDLLHMVFHLDPLVSFEKCVCV